MNKKRNYGKIAKVLCIIVGAFYMGSAVIAALSTLYQMLLKQLPHSGNLFENNQFYSLFDHMLYFLPLLLMLGLSYLIFGLKYHKISADKFKISLIIAIFSIIYSLAYSYFFLQNFNDAIKEVFNFRSAFRGLFFFLSLVIAIFTIAMHVIPQIFIGKMILKEKEQNLEKE